MKRFLLLCFISVVTTLANAQYRVVKKSLTDIGVVNNGATAVALQADKKMVVAGSVQEGNVYKICLVRYKQNGDVDSSFGKQGIDTFRATKILPAPYQGASLRSIAVQSDGKIIVAGTAWYVSGVNYLSNVLLIRFTQSGTIDSSFGENGTVRTNINSSTGLSVDEANAVKIQTDGKIIIAGQSYDYIQHKFLIIRYNIDGSLDNSFGNTGIVLQAIDTRDDEAFALAIQNTGKIIVAGEAYYVNTNYSIALVRYNVNGTIDKSFGKSGIVTTNLSAGDDIAKAIAIQDSSKIIITGSTLDNSSQQTDGYCLRYNNDGRIDSVFGNNKGLVRIDVAGKNDELNNVLLSNNKIVLSGTATVNDTSEYLCVRLLSNGKTDSSFANNGIETTSFYNQGDGSNGLIVSNNKIVLAGYTFNGASRYISLVRYTSNGALDNSFGTNGKKITAIGSSEDVATKMIRTPWDKSLLVSGIANGYWVVAKYNSTTLALDSGFGVNGTVSVNYKNQSDENDAPTLAVDASKQLIYLAGYTGNEVTITRFNKDGVVDKSFGDAGALTYPVTIFYGAFGIESDHKILLAGVRQQGSTGYNFIARLKANGKIDSSFGVNGEVQKLPLTPMCIQMKRELSSILISGRVPVGFDGGIGVLSLKKDGSYDQAFGNNGLIYKFSSAATAQIFFRYNMAQDQLGRILVSGGVQGSNFKYQFSVTRFTKKGSIDSSFANNGLFVKDVSSGSYSDNYNEGISAFCSNNNCSVLTSGVKMNDGNQQSKAVIITLKNNGTIDSLNNKTGYIDTSFYGDQYEASYAAVIDTISQSNLIMYIAGKASNGSNSDFQVIKLVKPINLLLANVDYVVSATNNILLSPNPAHSFVSITYNVSSAGNVNIRLTDLNGKIIKTKTTYNTKGKQQQTISLPTYLPAGVYIIVVSTGDERSSYKFIKE